MWNRDSAVAFASLLVLSSANSAKGSEPSILGLTPVGEQSCIAVEIDSPPGFGLSGLDWFHNDGSMAFPLVVLMEGLPGQPPNLADTAIVLAQVQGESLAWGQLDLTQAVSSGTGTIYAVFVLPTNAELTGKGEGTGPGIGIQPAAEGSDPPDIYLTSDGLTWGRYDATMELMVVPRLASAKSDPTSLAALKGTVGADLFDLSDPDASPSTETPTVATGLHPVVPNPFNPRTMVRFSLEGAGLVSLRIFDSRGRLVRTLHSGRLPAGTHSRVWRGRDDRGARVASGVFFLMMEAEGRQFRRKLALIR